MYKKSLIILAFLFSDIIAKDLPKTAVACAKTKQIALQKAKEKLAEILAPKPKFNLNQGFSSFPIVVDDLNLKFDIVKEFKQNNKNCVEIVEVKK